MLFSLMDAFYAHFSLKYAHFWYTFFSLEDCIAKFRENSMQICVLACTLFLEAGIRGKACNMQCMHSIYSVQSVLQKEASHHAYYVGICWLLRDCASRNPSLDLYFWLSMLSSWRSAQRIKFWPVKIWLVCKSARRSRSRAICTLRFFPVRATAVCAHACFDVKIGQQWKINNMPIPGGEMA